jgi:excisionase family DNA binding protein
VKDIAKMCGLSERYVHRLTQTGDLPSFKVGKAVLISARALDEWLGNKEVESGG